MKVTDDMFNPSGDSGIDQIKKHGLLLQSVIETYCPEGRRRSIALTELETCLMFAVKSCIAGDD